LHKDHLEVIDKNGKVKYIFKFGWNFKMLKKHLDELLKGGDHKW